MRDLRAMPSFRDYLKEANSQQTTTKSPEELRAMWAAQTWNRGQPTDASFNWGKAATAAGKSLAMGQVDDVIGIAGGQTAKNVARVGSDVVAGGMAAPAKTASGIATGAAKGALAAGAHMAADTLGAGGAFSAAKAAVAGYNAGAASPATQAKAAAEQFAKANGYPIEAFQLGPQEEAAISKTLGPAGLQSFYRYVVTYIQNFSNGRPMPKKVPLDYAIRLSRKFMNTQQRKPAAQGDVRPAERLLPRTPPARPGQRPGVSSAPLPAMHSDPAEINWLG